MFQDELDKVYNEVVRPLQNFDSKHSKGTMLRSMEFFEVFGKVMDNYAVKSKAVKEKLMNLYPNQKAEIQDYIQQLKDKIVSTYKPK